jgi:hypothetical protein
MNWRAAQLNLFGDGNFPFRTLLGHLANTNELMGALNYLSIVPSRFFFAVTNYTAAELAVVTNQAWYSVFKDQAGLTGWLVQSNTLDGSQIWARHLFNGKVAVCFYDPRGSNSTFTCSTAWLGIPTNTQVIYQSPWRGTNCVIQQSISANLATNTADLFVLTPISLGTNLVGNTQAIQGSQFIGSAAGLTNFLGLTITNSANSKLVSGGFFTAPGYGSVVVAVTITNNQRCMLSNATTGVYQMMGFYSGLVTNDIGASIPVKLNDSVVLTNLTGAPFLRNSWFISTQ